MSRKDILQAIDHTQLKTTATWEDISRLCDEAIAAGAASVCIPPSYVARACAYVQEKMTVCTVIGFPNGYQTTAVKCFETEEALRNGALEIDMVIHQGDVKDGRWMEIQAEIEAIKRLCQDKILKVIVETCYLTEMEKIKLCQIVSASGADFIKTSTGFGPQGATLEDVVLFRQHLAPNVQIKAAGGIRSIEMAQAFLDSGATRLGSSLLIRLLTPEK